VLTYNLWLTNLLLGNNTDISQLCDISAFWKNTGWCGVLVNSFKLCSRKLLEQKMTAWINLFMSELCHEG